MPRYFIELAYKGTAYSGFQVQENAVTVQAELARAMRILYRQSFELTGSSRTDSGVHARQNYFHFDTELVIEPPSVYNLNAILRPDITVKGIYAVPPDAHCRFDAVGREYNYYIYRYKNPFLDDRACLYPYPLDIQKLQEAAQILSEYQDFTSFSKRNTQVKTFNCCINISEWVQEEEMLVYRVSANRFLRGMVRGLVGTMLKLGRNQLTVSDFRQIIEAKDCSRADFSTPPQGLFLNKVIFKPEMGGYLHY